jgi:hypothetical protein
VSQIHCRRPRVAKKLFGLESACAERAMIKQEWGKRESREQEAGYDYLRYRKFLAEAIDETRRL